MQYNSACTQSTRIFFSKLVLSYLRPVFESLLSPPNLGETFFSSPNLIKLLYTPPILDENSLPSPDLGYHPRDVFGTFPKFKCYNNKPLLSYISIPLRLSIDLLGHLLGLFERTNTSESKLELEKLELPIFRDRYEA